MEPGARPPLLTLACCRCGVGPRGRSPGVGTAQHTPSHVLTSRSHVPGPPSLEVEHTFDLAAPALGCPPTRTQEGPQWPYQ